MAAIDDIKSYQIVEDNIQGSIDIAQVTLTVQNPADVEVVQLTVPTAIEAIDIGVVAGVGGGGTGGAVDSVNGHTGTVVLTKTDIGLANVDNTSDANKPVSTATSTALAGKANASHTHPTADVTGLDTALAGKADGSALTAHTSNTSNPHSVTKAQVGLGNVDNTADTAKPVSTAQQTALDGKQPLDSDLTAIAALAPTNDDVIQRKAGVWTNRTPAQVKTDLALTKSDVGLANVDNTSDANKPVSTATQTALNGKQNLDADLTAIAGLTPTANDTLQYKSGAWANRTPAQLKTDLSLTKSDVGLANVDNTADTAKPISTAQQTAFDARFVWADGTTSTNARPSTSSKVIWVGGTTQPVNMATGDLWIKA